jgi:hypothetical protein
MRLVDGTMIYGSAPRETTCSVAGCSGTDLYVQAHKATDGGAEIWWRCAQHLVHPTFIPLVRAAGLPPTCEVEVGNVPCGAMSTHVSLFRDRVGTTTERLGLVSACTRHAVRAW